MGIDAQIHTHRIPGVQLLAKVLDAGALRELRAGSARTSPRRSGGSFLQAHNIGGAIGSNHGCLSTKPQTTRRTNMIQPARELRTSDYTPSQPSAAGHCDFNMLVVQLPWAGIFKACAADTNIKQAVQGHTRYVAADADILTRHPRPGSSCLKQ